MPRSEWCRSPRADGALFALGSGLLSPRAFRSLHGPTNDFARTGVQNDGQIDQPSPVAIWVISPPRLVRSLWSIGNPSVGRVGMIVIASSGARDKTRFRLACRPMRRINRAMRFAPGAARRWRQARMRGCAGGPAGLERLPDLLLQHTGHCRARRPQPPFVLVGIVAARTDFQCLGQCHHRILFSGAGS